MSRGHDDYQSEPVRGLPERLPHGEHILWQGAPLWWQLAKDVFHIRVVAVYFASLMAWRGAVRFGETGGDLPAAVFSLLSLLPVTLAGLGLLALLAWLSSRTTVYTITNRRIVLRIGVALTTAINIPFGVIGAAGFRPSAGGAGDIPLSLPGADRIAYSTLWPHARPWRLRKPEPMLRGIPDARHVATVLSAALAEAMPGASVSPPIAAANQSNGNSSKAGGRAHPISASLRVSS
jgi:hypothetical protein